MRWSPGGWCGVALCFGLTCAHLPALTAEDAARDRRSDDAAAQLVRQALLAEASGETKQRTEFLQRAIVEQPDYAPAHWQSGEVRVGDRWLSVEAAAQEAARAGNVDKYRQLRSRVRASERDHLDLARWCAQHQLPDQERLHLLFALHFAPKSREAIEKLDLTRYNGALVPRAQAQAMDRRAQESVGVLKTWKTRLVKLRRDIESNNTAKQIEATQELRSIDNPLLIPALEFLTTDSTAATGEAVVASLSKMPDQLATDSLARHAVFAEQQGVRKAASEALRSRSIFSYVPTMMFALQSPTDLQLDISYMNGQMLHRLAMFQRGPFVDHSFVSSGGTSERIRIHLKDSPWSNEDITLPDMTLPQDSLLAQRELQTNAAKQQLNDRIVAALQIATGNELPADPQKWWDWWFDYNEIYRPPIKPVTQTVRNYIPPPVTVRFASCFVAGTQVSTSTGPMAIEQIQIGECILAQNIETGELAYKPVIGTTVRPPSPLVVISVGGETIRATRGHPFWISGIGWQMAKELKAGQTLHTPHGPLPIDSISEAEAATCYNLVVADFGTYFITDQHVLVHDNNLRQVTTATVPGLIAP